MKVKLTRDKRNKSSPWVCRWSEGPDFDTGKWKWRSKSFRYKLDAENFKIALRNEQVPEIAVRPRSGITVGEFRQEWTDTMAGRFAASTLDLYRGAFDRLEDFFGPHRPLRDVTRQQAEKFIMRADYRCPGHKKKNELSESSRTQLVSNCKALFNKAIKWNYMKSNPFQGMDRPDPEENRFHKLTADEENALRQAAPTLRHKALYDVLLTTGARLNEVLSRTWADFDFDNGQMIICDRKGRPDLPSFRLKTRKGKVKQRVIPLSPGTIDILTQLQTEAPEGVPYVFLARKRYERIKKRWDKIGHKDKLWKNAWLSNNVLRSFKVHCRNAGIKPTGQLCIHTLRKNTGQNLADAGLPLIVVQKILGHSRPETTLKFYNQMDPHHLEQVRRAVDKRRSDGTKKRVQERTQVEKKYVSGTYEPDFNGSERER